MAASVRGSIFMEETETRSPYRRRIQLVRPEYRVNQQMDVTFHRVSRRNRACALFAGFSPFLASVPRHYRDVEGLSRHRLSRERRSKEEATWIKLIAEVESHKWLGSLWRTEAAWMNSEAIARCARMLKIVKVGSNGLRRLHTSNKVRGITDRTWWRVDSEGFYLLDLLIRGLVAVRSVSRVRGGVSSIVS